MASSEAIFYPALLPKFRLKSKISPNLGIVDQAICHRIYVINKKINF